MSGNKIRMLVNYLEALKNLRTLENWIKFSILYLFLAVRGELNKMLRIYDVRTKWISSVKWRGRMLKNIQIWSGICIAPKKSVWNPNRLSLKHVLEQRCLYILQVRSSEKWMCASTGMDTVGNGATAIEEIWEPQQMAICSGKVLSAHMASTFLPHLELLLQVIRIENE